MACWSRGIRSSSHVIRTTNVALWEIEAKITERFKTWSVHCAVSIFFKFGSFWYRLLITFAHVERCSQIQDLKQNVKRGHPIMPLSLFEPNLGQRSMVHGIAVAGATDDYLVYLKSNQLWHLPRLTAQVKVSPKAKNVDNDRYLIFCHSAASFSF